MDIYGLGSDIVAVHRIATLIERYGERFLEKFFSQEERLYCMRQRRYPIHFAGRFAAKEAAAKSVGTGFGSVVSWCDFYVINDARGKPELYLSPGLKERLPPLSFFLSISHCEEYATATVIACRDQNPEV